MHYLLFYIENWCLCIAYFAYKSVLDRKICCLQLLPTRKKSFEINFLFQWNASKLDQGIYKVKLKVAKNEKWKKLLGFLFL